MYNLNLLYSFETVCCTIMYSKTTNLLILVILLKIENSTSELIKLLFFIYL